MQELSITHVDDGTKQLPVAKDDLVAAWTLLENLLVSMDRIGSRHGYPPGQAPSAKVIEDFEKALGSFLSSHELLHVMLDARSRLGKYLSDSEAESLSDRIAFWHERAPENAIGNKK